MATAFSLENDPKQQSKMKPFPPLGTLYSASLLREAGFSVALHDATFDGRDDSFLAALDAVEPCYVVFYDDIFNFVSKMCLSHVRRAIHRRTRLAIERGITVIVAGVDATGRPKLYLDGGAHFCLVGEAERSLVELIEALENGCSGSEVPGVVTGDFASDFDLVTDLPRRPLTDLDSLPIPAWDLVDIESYRRAWVSAQSAFTLNMVASRGCTHKCIWCAKPLRNNSRAVRAPIAVADEMATVFEAYAPERIWFADDLFPLDVDWLGPFSKALEARNLTLPFSVQARADQLTKEVVKLLGRCGCHRLWFGLETGSQRLLDKTGKGLRIEDYRRARSLLLEVGIEAACFVQFGLPTESMDDIWSTVELIRELRPDDIGVSVFHPLPGSPYFDKVKGRLVGDATWSHSHTLSTLLPDGRGSRTYRELHQLLHREVVLYAGLTAPKKEDVEALEGAWNEFSISTKKST